MDLAEFCVLKNNCATMEANCKMKTRKEETVKKNVLKEDEKIESEILEKKLFIPGKRRLKRATFSSRNKKSRNSLISGHESVNGTVFADKYIPEELLIEILCQVDSKSLLTCQLVCHHWKKIIQSRVWHKKAEQTTKQTVIFDKRTPWKSYYCLSNKMPFNTNLIKNHSGQDGLGIHWELPPIKSIRWSIENPMLAPLLPDDSLFEKENVCFVTSSSMTWKYQVVDLIKEGFLSYLLDYLQPTIQVSEWYCCSNTPAKYICDIELLKDNGEKKMIFSSLENYDDSSYDMYDHHTFSRIVRERNQWYKYEHEFKNYGQGLRKIKFTHGGRKINHYDGGTENDSGTKMARACIKIDLPSLDYDHIKSLSSYY